MFCAVSNSRPAAPAAPLRVFDPARLAAVAHTGLLDTGPEEPFDRLSRLAATLLEVPMAFVTIVDERRSYWKSCIGVGSADPADRQIKVEESFCQYVVGAAEPLIVTDARADERTRDNPAVTGMGVAAWAGYPIHSPDGQVLGTFCVVDTAPRSWSARDLEVLDVLSQAASGEVALRHAIDIANRHAAELLVAGRQSAALAQTLQESLLPAHPPEVPGVEVAARYLPAAGGAEVVGDFYDVFQSGRTTWSLVIGDVAGKGVEAAKTTALARYTIRAAAMRTASPRRVLWQLNEALLVQRPDEETFLTACYAALRLGSNAAGGVGVTICSAGHAPALMCHRDGRVSEVGGYGQPLGLFANAELADHRLSLLPGDALVLHTDGVTEARRGKAFFGEQRLHDLLTEAAGLSAAQVALKVETAVCDFTGGPLADDTAVLVLRVPPQPCA